MRRECGQRGQNVYTWHAPLGATVDEWIDKLRAEQFASGALWRLLRKVRLVEQLCEQAIVHATQAGERAVVVEAVHAATEPPGGGVDQSVATPSIEVNDRLP